MSRLTAEGLLVRRGDRRILHGIDLVLEGGAMVAVVGPNGAGKSTLLADLAGLARPDAGEGTLDGRPLAAWYRRALARVRAYLPQGARAEWPVPVERLVALGLTPHLPPFGPLPPAMAERVAVALQSCDLAGQASQPATTLSGGELARAMLGRALVGEPRVLIVDEPMAGLDPRHALDAMTRLRGLADTGVLVIAAVHDLTLAARFSSRLIVLREGELVADGATGEILTPDLVRRVFDIEARVTGAGTTALIDFAAPARHARPQS